MSCIIQGQTMSTEPLKSIHPDLSRSPSELDITPEERLQEQRRMGQQSLVINFLNREFGKELPSLSPSANAVILRLTKEVQRICEKRF